MRDDLYGPTWGEQGAYGGLGPGIPMMDILGDYGSGESIGDLDPLKAVGGSLTIPVKLGLEQLLKIGGNEDAVAVDIRTGIPILISQITLTGNCRLRHTGLELLESRYLSLGRIGEIKTLRSRDKT